MTAKTAGEIRISFAQVTSGGSEEALIEFYTAEKSAKKDQIIPPLSATYVSSSKNDGVYDTVGAASDADGDDDVDDDDKALFCALAQAASKALKKTA